MNHDLLAIVWLFIRALVSGRLHIYCSCICFMYFLCIFACHIAVCIYFVYLLYYYFGKD